MSDLSDVPDCPGVYIIETGDGFKFPYPLGENKIIYIGKSDTSLNQRLKRHRTNLMEIEINPEYGLSVNEPWISSRYQYMHYHGSIVYYYKCKGKQDAKDLESMIMWEFYKKFRALPVGNGAKSYAKE